MFGLSDAWQADKVLIKKAASGIPLMQDCHIRLGRAPVASNVQITYDKMSDPVLIEISLGHDEPGTVAANEVLT